MSDDGAGSDTLFKQPRRRIELVAHISADSWDALTRHLRCLETEIAVHGRLPTKEVSGGYSSGHVLVSSEDGTITHDSWAARLMKHLDEIEEKGL